MNEDTHSFKKKKKHFPEGDRRWDSLTAFLHALQALRGPQELSAALSSLQPRLWVLIPLLALPPVKSAAWECNPLEGS